MKKMITLKMLAGVASAVITVTGIAVPMTISSNRNVDDISIAAEEEIQEIESIVDDDNLSDTEAADDTDAVGNHTIASTNDTSAVIGNTVNSIPVTERSTVNGVTAGSNEQPAVEKAATEKITDEQKAAEKRTDAEQPAVEKAAAEKITDEQKAAEEQAAAEKAAAEQATAEKAEAQRIAVEREEKVRFAPSICSSTVIIPEKQPVIKKIIHYSCYCGADFTDKEAFKQHAAEGTRRGEIHSWHNWTEEVEVWE